LFSGNFFQFGGKGVRKQGHQEWGALEASGEKQKAEFLAEAVTLSDELWVWKAETPEPE
jgi:hypothetical protein